MDREGGRGVCPPALPGWDRLLADFAAADELRLPERLRVAAVLVWARVVGVEARRLEVLARLEEEAAGRALGGAVATAETVADGVGGPDSPEP